MSTELSAENRRVGQPPSPHNRRREAIRAAAGAGIELAGAAIGVPHIAAYKTLFAGPTPDNLAAMLDEAETFAAGEPQPTFEQLSQKLTGAADTNSTIEKAGRKVLDAATPVESAPQKTRRQPAPAFRAEQQARLAALRQEFERIAQELDEVGTWVKKATSQDVLRYQFDQSEADVKAARARLITPQELGRVAHLFAQVITELYAEDPPRQRAAQEKLYAQYHQIIEHHKQLELAFDALEGQFARARSLGAGDRT